MSWNVKFFVTARGRYPVKEFIEDQEMSTQTKITHAIDFLETYGPYLRSPYSKKLQDKMHELRISGKIAIRIFYTMTNSEYYLLHAFQKKSQKTPYKELQTALDRLKEVI